MKPINYEAPFTLNLYPLVLSAVLVYILSLTVINLKKENIYNLINNLNFIQLADLSNLVPILIIFNAILLLNFNFVVDFAYINTLIIVFFLYMIPIFLIPIVYFLVFSTGSLMCIGLTQKKSVFVNAINDYITLVSFLLRFVSQFIRVVLITLVLILLYEFIHTTFNIYLVNILSHQSSLVSTIAVSLIRLVFELIDCFFIFLIQFNAFFIILL